MLYHTEGNTFYCYFVRYKKEEANQSSDLVYWETRQRDIFKAASELYHQVADYKS
jgi:hypothetical protein